MSDTSMLLNQFTRKRDSELPNLRTTDPAQLACERAQSLLAASRSAIAPGERRQAEQLARMMNDDAGKALTFAMVDEVFRSHDAAVQARHWRRLLRDFGVPRYFSTLDRTLTRVAALCSRLVPGLVMPFIERRMRAESATVILDGTPQRLQQHLSHRREQGYSLNLNHLGEAVLGEAEASRRLDAVIELMQNPAISYVSVKVSAIFSQISLVAWDESLAEIKNRLRQLYRASIRHGSFVNLDMEEYRDLELTLAAYRDVLDEPEFTDLSAGIVLQAYLPDSWAAQRGLVAWAQQRVARGGAPVKMRLVKGANLAMEQVEAELHGWNAAPYGSKAETDAGFRRMLEFGCQPEAARAVHLGVASHNLFDVALALVMREHYGTSDCVEIEMLEGMANHQARTVRDAAGGLLLYAPTVQPQDFLSAMAYLVRRLDENTAPDNFLHDLFDLTPGSVKWVEQRDRFLAGWNQRNRVSDESRRAKSRPVEASVGFVNEPDSDWTQRDVRRNLAAAIAAWVPVDLPPVPDVDEVLSRATAASASWRQSSPDERAAILRRAADLMQQERFQTLACLQQDGKKAVSESDAEVSEAIDFARYYSRFEVPAGVNASPLGVVVITPPWNFPCAIPCGGVLAALMAGNVVVLKPAPEVVNTAWHLVQQLWRAGVPKDVLQFCHCPDGPIGKSLLTDSRVDCVVLTGAWETARLFQSWRPSLTLYAETSGKNALVITRHADRELAVRDLVRSAFCHSGQKCSAASLAIVEAEVYDDPAFRRQLADAANSLVRGPATDLSSIVTPLVQPPGNALRRALTQLDEGETWLLEPRLVGNDPCLWSPGIRLGVRPGSWFHQTECFGPVLGLMRASGLDEAIAWQNAACYGLTAGIHSLDPEEQRIWSERVEAGNLYINRPITGAIVQRQPFGGWKRSCIGPGAKAGGPNYVSLFCRFSDGSDADSQETAAAQFQSNYEAAWAGHFAIPHDPSALRCESNIFHYRPSRGVVLRLESHDATVLNRARCAADLCGTPLEVSLRDQESDEDFATRLPTLADRYEFLRTVNVPSDAVLNACHSSGLNWINAPVTSCGRIELRFWLREQSLSRTRHRYGQLPAWQPESRKL